MNNAWVNVGGGGSPHILLRLGPTSVTNGIDIRLGNKFSSTVLAASAPFIVSQSIWYFIEMKVTIADSGGNVRVRINEQEVINFTGDTRNGGAAQVDYITIGHDGVSSGPADLWDDWYWLDGTGSAPYNDYLGDVKVETLVPNGAGASTQLIPSTGANWQCVDEQPPSTADYVSSATVGQRDTYAHTDLVTTNAQVFGVQVQSYAQASDAGIANLKCVTRGNSGALRYGASSILSSTPGWVMGGVQTTDPDNNPWTIASVNAAEHGVEVA
jgi:hypothetical protein